MKINEAELEDLEIFDAEVAEKYENLLENIVIETEKLKEAKDMRASESIRKQCRLVFGVFNELFGPGTDIKIFGGKTNLLVCMKAFEELVTYCNSQKSVIEKISSKYDTDRAQRRAKK